MAIPGQNINYKKTGVGMLYIAAAPTTASTTDDYYEVFFGSAGAAKKKTLDTGIVPFANLTEFKLSIKPSTVEFNPLAGTKTKVETGIDEASAEFSFYDLDAAHLNFMYGGNAADIETVAAASGTAARKISLIGPNAGGNASYCAMFRMPSPTVSGEFTHYLITNCSPIGELDLTFSKSNPIAGKITLQCDVSPFLFNAKGYGVVMLTDDPTAPATI